MRGLGPAALAGGVAMAFALLVAYLASAVGFPYPPAALGQAIIEALPGFISIPLIELLQHWAQRLLVIGVLGLYMLSGVATGMFAASSVRATSLVVALAALPWMATILLAQLLAGSKIDLGGDLFASSLGAAAFFSGLSYLLAAERVATPATATRRRALLAGLGASAALAVLSIALGGALRAARGAVEPVASAVRHLRKSEPVTRAEPAFEAVEGITKRITPNQDHYVVDTTLIKPRVDPSTWTLVVTGLVDRPFALGYQDLLDLEAVERPHTLECISNEIGGDLTSTAVWSGVPMADLLARAGVGSDAFDVVLTSVDGYTDSIPIAKALDPDTLVAYLMNGYTLPEEHGFPARALIPGIYGMKNVKWLTKIEVVSYDYQGYWMVRGWSDLATYNTHVRIDTAGGAARSAGGIVTVAGIAFAGQRGISRVELSTDGGATWADAELEVAPGRQTWRRWRYLWKPSAAARYRLVARATDGTGQLQTSVQRPPFPDGSTGYHTVEVTVQS